jgi:hypothetical protein
METEIETPAVAPDGKVPSPIASSGEQQATRRKNGRGTRRPPAAATFAGTRCGLVPITAADLRRRFGTAEPSACGFAMSALARALGCRLVGKSGRTPANPSSDWPPIRAPLRTSLQTAAVHSWGIRRWRQDRLGRGAPPLRGLIRRGNGRAPAPERRPCRPAIR